MAASGSIVEEPMALVEAVNAVSIPEAKLSYQLMSKALGSETPLIFASLPISAAAISEGLLAYETTLATAALAYRKAGVDAPHG